MSSKSALESKTGGSGVYSYNNWAMCQSFFLKQSLVEEEKCQDHCSLNFKSVSVSHVLTLSLYPSSFGSQKERRMRDMVRELLGRRSCMLKNGAQSVKKNRGGSDLSHLVTLPPYHDTESDRTSLTTSGSFSQKMGPGSCVRAAMCQVRYQCYKLVLFFFLKGQSFSSIVFLYFDICSYYFNTDDILLPRYCASNIYLLSCLFSDRGQAHC